MKAVQCHNSQLTVVDVEAPEAGPGQLVIDVERCGICGSDLHARVHADQLVDAAAAVGYETIMKPTDQIVFGHEFVGRVAGYGPGTRAQWKPGTRVVGLPIVRHGDDAHAVGFDTASPGAYAEQVVLQEAFTFPVPDHVPAEKAAFTEPMAVALHAVRRGSVGRGQTAVVIGCGPIGLAVILMLKATGVKQVIASDFSPKRRELAVRCGADVVVDPREQDPLTVVPSTGPTASFSSFVSFGIDTLNKARRVPGLPWPRLMQAAKQVGQGPSGPVIFECVGVPGIVDQIIAGAPMMSRVVVVGVCMEPDTLRPSIAINKEIDLRFVLGYDPGEFAQTLDMIVSGKVDPSPLHTGTVGLAGVAGAFEALGNPELHAKILVDPSSDAFLAEG
ncbi:MAG TPA: zinc-binding dehydrogenase [Aeromicrobium sp.]|nr:zinc-binding dehydrogenase [Aeromicrobium sp.]